MSAAVVPTPPPPEASHTGGAAPSPARRVVEPVALMVKGQEGGMSGRAGSPRGSHRAGSPSDSAGSPAATSQKPRVPVSVASVLKATDHYKVLKVPAGAVRAKPKATVAAAFKRAVPPVGITWFGPAM